MATTDTLAAPHTEARPEVTRIRPSRGWRAIDLREIWRYRELLWFLTLRDVKLRYKQTALGVAWVVIQPHTRFVLAALVPWQLFAYHHQRIANQRGDFHHKLTTDLVVNHDGLHRGSVAPRPRENQVGQELLRCLDGRIPATGRV